MYGGTIIAKPVPRGQYKDMGDCETGIEESIYMGMGDLSRFLNGPSRRGGVEEKSPINKSMVETPGWPRTRDSDHSSLREAVYSRSNRLPLE